VLVGPGLVLLRDVRCERREIGEGSVPSVVIPPNSLVVTVLITITISHHYICPPPTPQMVLFNLNGKVKWPPFAYIMVCLFNLPPTGLLIYCFVFPYFFYRTLPVSYANTYVFMPSR